MSNIHHLAFSVRDLEASSISYDAILAPLGYARTLDEGHIKEWEGPGLVGLLLYQANLEHAEAIHRTYDPGIHHVAFFAPDRSAVDACHSAAVKVNLSVLEGPCEFPHYAPGYYAVFIEDRDGIKIEFMTSP